METFNVNANEDGIAKYRINIPIDNLTSEVEKLYHVEVLDSENNKINLIREKDEFYFDRIDKIGFYDFTVNLIKTTNIIESRKIRITIIENIRSNIVEWIDKVDASLKMNKFQSVNSKKVWFSITREFGSEAALKELHRFILNEMSLDDNSLIFKVIQLLSYTHDDSNLLILDYLYKIGLPDNMESDIVDQLIKNNSVNKVDLLIKMMKNITLDQLKLKIINAIAILRIDVKKYEEDFLSLLEIEGNYQIQSALIKILVNIPSERLRKILEKLLFSKSSGTQIVCLSSLSLLWPSERTFDLIAESALHFDATYIHNPAPFLSTLYPINRDRAMAFAKEMLINRRISICIKRDIIDTLMHLNSNEILAEVKELQKIETDNNLLLRIQNYIDKFKY
ncbi:MAG: hypothetical protein K9N07_07395 [Candidatus Cloacimonetes bacterium]|nr:hypothetical protein [Candidatus Cloacimonadota bacterium]